MCGFFLKCNLKWMVQGVYSHLINTIWLDLVLYTGCFFNSKYKPIELLRKKNYVCCNNLKKVIFTEQPLSCYLHQDVINEKNFIHQSYSLKTIFFGLDHFSKVQVIDILFEKRGNSTRDLFPNSFLSFQLKWNSKAKIAKLYVQGR